MGDYRRMGSVVQHIGNAMSTTLMHKLRGLWMNPRGTVLRIEALALVAIAISFFLATYGSCRRWSNSWILQKGFLAANALFLSLGTYSIGLMQSSPVKSEMYPIWAVSLFALLCCVDSVTMFSFDNKSQVWKMLYQLFLYCGYVLLMSISSISSDIGNIAICVLSAITLLKGFHKSMALLLPGRMRNVIRDTQDSELFIVGLRYFTREKKLMVHLPLDEDNAAKVAKTDVAVKVHAINSMYKGGELRSDIRDVCLSLSLSHMLQLRLLGVKEDDESMIFDKSVSFNWFELKGDHDGVMEWAFKVVEVELAFLYDILFTSNAFLHYYEAKTASIWVLVSLVGICFVGVVAAMPGTRTVRWASSSSSSSSSSGGHGTAVVGTTTADLVITGAILVSLALLQVVQLLRCWTSNWARVAFACDCARKRRKQEEEAEVKQQQQHQRRKQEEEAEVKQQQQQGGDSVQGIHLKRGWCLRLRAHLLRINWFESYLWQDKLGQHSMVEPTGGCLQCFTRPAEESTCASVSRKYCSIVSGMLGLRCVGRELLEALCGSGTGDTTIELHSDVKASVAGFLSEIRSDDASAWPSPTVGDERRRIEQMSKRSDNESARLGSKYNPALRKTRSRVYDDDPHLESAVLESAARRKLSVAEKYTSSVLTWHVATCYCELAQRHDDKGFLKGCSTGAERAAVEKDHRVAMALSKYCAYLVASVPELLPGPPVDTKKVYDAVARRAREVRRGGGGEDKLLAAMDKMDTRDHLQELRVMLDERLWMDRPFDDGVQLGQELRRKPPSERWKELAGFWVKALVYAAPSENTEEHMQRLAQGGEFITHVWALLSHAGIRRWQGGLEEPAVTPGAGAGAGAAHGASSTSYRPRHRLRRSASIS